MPMTSPTINVDIVKEAFDIASKSSFNIAFSSIPAPTQSRA